MDYINPHDLHDPIDQVFVGEQINMDNFFATLGPNKEKCAQNVTNESYVASPLSPFYDQNYFPNPFGVEVTQFQVKVTNLYVTLFRSLGQDSI